MIIVKKETEASTRHVRFRGITEATVIDSEEGLFAALLELAYHHTANDMKIYENAAINSIEHDQKILFLQLIFRKNDIINKIQTYLPEFYLSGSQGRELEKRSPSKNFAKKSSFMPQTSDESFQFAFRRENRTLALYNKLKEKMRHDSTKALFDYLVTTQYDCILYLTKEFAEQGSVVN